MTKKESFIMVVGIALLVFAFGMNIQANSALECNYQCVTCENAAKTENGSENYDEIVLNEGENITEVYVKAGQGCYVPDGTCYNIVGGGVGYNYVQVERVGDGPECQGISHLEVCFSVASPTDTPQVPTDTEEPTPTDTPLHEPSNTPDPSNTPSATPEVTPTWTPHPPRTPNGNGRG
jgi:hypothetical protein